MNKIKENNFGLTDFYNGIYKYMILGILISGIFSYIVINTNYLTFIFKNPVYFYGIVGIEIALMLGVQFLIRKITPSVSLWLFLIYAALNGISLSGLFMIYSINSILAVFIGAITIFVILAVWGYTTKKDLTGMRTFLMLSIWAIFIGSILNMFFQNSIFDTIVSIAALIIFSATTVYDNQVYKSIYNSVAGNKKEEKRYIVLGALQMYINFIMIFTNLLKFFGNEE